MAETDLILIGRNEGARLERALAAAQGLARRLIYVDSGSSDGSIAVAQAAGAEVVELSPDAPFTAARARDTGFQHLEETGGAAEFAQFIDGDSEIQPDWIPTAMQALTANPDLGLVTGWRAEIAPDASVYNALCQVEWRRPAGDIVACGGDMMVRAAAYRTVGGFDARVIAAEDDELCCRLRKSGWRLHRLPIEMTRHDAAMSRFGQWWRRAERSGHGFEQVNDLHPDYFRRERLRIWVYGAGLPLLMLVALMAGWFWIAAAILALYGLSYLRTMRGLIRRDGLTPRDAAHHAVFLTLSKLPNVLGAIRYRWRRIMQRDMAIIEYK